MHDLREADSGMYDITKPMETTTWMLSKVLEEARRARKLDSVQHSQVQRPRDLDIAKMMFVIATYIKGI